MTTHELTIKVELPDGWELTGEVRQVQFDELYYDWYGRVLRWEHTRPSLHTYPIVRKRWQVPDWVPEGARIYQEYSGSTVILSNGMEFLATSIAQWIGESWTDPPDSYFVQQAKGA